MPDRYVVDTDVVSYLFRNDSRADLYRPYLTDSVGTVSFMTIAELERWAIAYRWGESRRQRLEDHLDQFAIILVDRRLCRIWARVVDQARRNGRPILTADAWIAATAIRLDAPLLTNNRSDYAGVDELILAPTPFDELNADRNS